MREQIDLEALLLCSDEDLQSIQMQLGPRKKVLNAINRRKQVLQQPGQLVDTSLWWIVGSTGWVCSNGVMLWPMETLRQHLLCPMPDRWEWFLGFQRYPPKKEALTVCWEILYTCVLWPPVSNPRRSGNKKWCFSSIIFLILLYIERVKWMTEKGITFFSNSGLKNYNLSSHKCAAYFLVLKAWGLQLQFCS